MANFEKAFEEKYQIGKSLIEDSKYDEAYACFLHLAESGYPKGQYALGLCHELGYGTSIDEEKAFSFYMQAANNGDARAQCSVARFYEQGKIVEANDDEVFHWFFKSAKQGFDHAQFCLGICYSEGIGTEKDYYEAFNWYLKAALQKYGDAERAVGLCFEEGRGTRIDKRAAFEWMKKSTEHGCRNAFNDLGFYYKDGIGVKPNPNKAYECFFKAAQEGDDSGQNNLGYCYEYGIAVPVDYSQAVYWYQKAVSQGLPAAQFNLGRCLYYGKGVSVDHKKAFECFSSAADEGLVEAQFNEGCFYLEGDVIKKDEGRAFELFQKAAKKGLDVAQFNLSILYQNGQGIAQNKEKSFYWCLRAAEQELSLAQYNTGVKYLLGEGVKKDESAAFYWFHASAMNGCAEGENNLAYCYEKGIGTAIDLEKAFAFYGLSAEKGYSLGQENVGHCYKQGKGTEKNIEKAIKWFSRAAEKDDEGKILLGALYLEEKRYTEAYYWIKKAADNNHPYAQAGLALFYLDKKSGINTNKDTALGYIFKALQKETPEVDYLVGYAFFKYFDDYPKAKLYYKKAMSNNALIEDIQNKIALTCFIESIQQKKKSPGKGNEVNAWEISAQEGFKYATKSAENDNPIGLLILSIAFNNGIGVKQDTKKGRELSRKAIANGLKLEPDDAMDFDDLVKTDLVFPSTDFIIAKFQSTDKSITVSKAINKALGLYSLMIENDYKKTRRVRILDESVSIGTESVPEYVMKRFESWDPQRNSDFPAYLKPGNLKMHLDSEEIIEQKNYEDVKKVIEYAEFKGISKTQLLNSEKCMEIIEVLFELRSDREKRKIFYDVKDALFAMSNSSSHTVGLANNEEEKEVEIEDKEAIPILDQIIADDQNVVFDVHKERQEVLKNFINGFDSMIPGQVNKEVATLYMVRILLYPIKTPVQDKEEWEGREKTESYQKTRDRVGRFFSKSINGVSLNEIKEILLQTTHLCANIDWYYSARLENQPLVHSALDKSDIRNHLDFNDKDVCELLVRALNNNLDDDEIIKLVEEKRAAYSRTSSKLDEKLEKLIEDYSKNNGVNL